MAADLMSLDAFLGKKELAKGASAVVVISSTYNGTPPDNAAQFMRTCLVLLRGLGSGCFGLHYHYMTRPTGPPPSHPTGFLEDPAAVAAVFKGVPVSVFGCGNTQWARTYQVSGALGSHHYPCVYPLVF